MKKYLIITAILMSSLSAHAQNFFGSEYQAFLGAPTKHHAKTSAEKIKPEDIFQLVKQDDGKKITELLKNSPEAVSLREDECWYPIQRAIWDQKINAAKAIILFLNENDMLEQLNERGQTQDEGCEGSADDLNHNLVSKLLTELQINVK